jgi:hypothetical protein
MICTAIPKVNGVGIGKKKHTLISQSPKGKCFQNLVQQSTFSQATVDIHQ